MSAKTMRYLLTLSAIFLAGFLWQLGRDAARAVTIRRNGERRHYRLSLRRRGQLSEEPDETRILYIAGIERAERWTVQ